VNGLRDRIRKDIHLAKVFEACVKRDIRFEAVGDTQLGLSCFRLKGDGLSVDNLNASLLEALNSTHKIHMVPSSYLGKYVIRFAICSVLTNEADIELAWSWISDYAEVLIRLHEKDDDEDLLELLDAANRWKKFHQRPMNMDVLHQLRDYYRKKNYWGY
jgi:aromatic-L-amino-acid decarboxylase